MKGLGNITGMMKQAQQIQKRLGEMQSELEREEITVSSGGDMVTVTMNGKQKIVSIKIDPEIVDPNEMDMLQDLIMVAVNEAQDRVQAMVKERMSDLTGGINIPGLTS